MRTVLSLQSETSEEFLDFANSHFICLIRMSFKDEVRHQEIRLEKVETGL